MKDKIFPKKIFKIGPMGNSLLVNAEENTAFIFPRIEKLRASKYGSKSFFDDLEEIFAEFVEVYEHDKKTAQLPEPFGSFKNDTEKQEWIDNHLLAIEFDYHLGAILYNYHDWLADNDWPDIILSRLVTDYPSVYERVIYDYVSVLKRKPPKYQVKIKISSSDDKNGVEREILKHAMQRDMWYGYEKPYFAAFALPSLIERFSIDFTQQGLIFQLLSEVVKKSSEGKIHLGAEDRAFIQQITTPNAIMNGSKNDAMRRCRDIFINAGLTLDKDTESIVLGTNGNSPLTLGQFLRNSYVKKHIKKPYFDILDILFSTKKINLRNSIMHGASILFDPYSLCFSAVMLQIFWGIIDRSIFE